jgi:hypothetical protein
MLKVELTGSTGREMGTATSMLPVYPDPNDRCIVMAMKVTSTETETEYE